MIGPLSRCLSILIYHRVTPEPDPLLPEETCAAEFDWQLAALNRWFSVLPLREAVAGLRAGTLPRRAACITFDDGYADNASVALPILRRRGMHATFFVATGFLDGGMMWNDLVIETIRAARGDALDARGVGLQTIDVSTTASRREAIGKALAALKYLPIEERQARAEEFARSAERPPGPMMTTAQVRELCAGGMEVGAHTVTHPILAQVDRDRAASEIRESKNRLEQITGKPVALFAYPNGKPGRDYRSEHVGMVRDLGFEAAVCTAWGVGNEASDTFQLPRFTPWDRTPSGFVLRLFRNTFRTGSERV